MGGQADTCYIITKVLKKDFMMEAGNGEAVAEADSDCSQIANNKNARSVVCQRCQCLVLKPHAASYATKEIFMPHMRKKEGVAFGDGENLHKHWMVKNMMTFENVGFLKNVGTTKFLICADCEVGPIGWHSTEVKDEFYIALDRVEHMDK